MNSPIIQEPIFVFTIVMAVIFLSPYVMRLMRLPEIAGVIFFGIILGPDCLNVLERDTGILLFGTVGIIYIMFYSGLEIDLKDFKKKKDKSIAFGLLTFIIPMSAGFLAGHFLLKFDLTTSILFGSIFSSHTLLTYPAAGKLGVKDNEAVVVTVGGTLITNSISMLILAVISSKALNVGESWYNAPLLFVSFSLLVVILVPKFSRWFFRIAESESYTQYIFIITILFAVASVGKLLGIEPIIGAFLAGLAVNTLIPANSILMNRIGFIGNTLFVPFFLMYVGMLTNLKLLFGGWKTIGMAFLMFVLAVPTKYFAAYFTQKFFKYSKNQRDLIFGLSNTQAANTLAAVFVGVKIGLFTPVLLDASILLMLVTCIISAIFTEKAAKAISSEKKESYKDEDIENNGTIQEKILLLLSNPKTVTKLVDLSIMMKNPKNENPIFPLNLVVDGNDVKEGIEKKQKLLEQAQTHASGTNQLTHLITRVDVNVASGVKLVSKEFSITHIILGWNSSQVGAPKIFGTVLDHILSVSENIIVSVKSVVDWHVIERTILFISPNALIEYNFLLVILPILRVASSLKTKIILYGSRLQYEEVVDISRKNNINLDIVFEEKVKSPVKFAKETIRQNDFSVIINGRKNSLSFSEEYEKVPSLINGKLPKENFMVVYPPKKEKEVRYITNY
ncbi:MAG: cation:proton antiporter [Chitinispirillales bacterium]|jgi:Kef-type K+ transport system membrane component KefB|nr:cation:proton antiporter [Chitinispirillales bacterium]